MWGYVTGWVWLILSLAMIGVLAVAVLCISPPLPGTSNRGDREMGSPDDDDRPTLPGHQGQRRSPQLGHHAQR